LGYPTFVPHRTYTLRFPTHTFALVHFYTQVGLRTHTHVLVLVTYTLHLPSLPGCVHTLHTGSFGSPHVYVGSPLLLHAGSPHLRALHTARSACGDTPRTPQFAGYAFGFGYGFTRFYWFGLRTHTHTLRDFPTTHPHPHRNTQLVYLHVSLVPRLQFSSRLGFPVRAFQVGWADLLRLLRCSLVPTGYTHPTQFYCTQFVTHTGLYSYTLRLVWFHWVAYTGFATPPHTPWVHTFYTRLHTLWFSLRWVRHTFPHTPHLHTHYTSHSLPFGLHSHLHTHYFTHPTHWVYRLHVYTHTPLGSWFATHTHTHTTHLRFTHPVYRFTVYCLPHTHPTHGLGSTHTGLVCCVYIWLLRYGLQVDVYTPGRLPFADLVGCGTVSCVCSGRSGSAPRTRAVGLRTFTHWFTYTHAHACRTTGCAARYTCTHGYPTLCVYCALVFFYVWVGSHLPRFTRVALLLPIRFAGTGFPLLRLRYGSHTPLPVCTHAFRLHTVGYWFHFTHTHTHYCATCLHLLPLPTPTSAHLHTAHTSHTARWLPTHTPHYAHTTRFTHTGFGTLYLSLHTHAVCLHHHYTLVLVYVLV